MPHVIALNDLARHHAPLRQELEAAMARVNDRGWYILGPEVDAFEREFAAYLGVAECIAVAIGGLSEVAEGGVVAGGVAAS